MAHKQRLEEIIVNIKKWNETNGNEELQAYLDALEAEITSMGNTTSAYNDPGGNNPPAPQVP
jgi:restriction endonuclease Mrr